MKITTPEFYKDFKCIAGACTDTCCAGWDVDVDEKSYKYYKSVKGPFGKRLKSVMVPSEEGGCTFTLNDKRCPFLNDKNLCDLFIELGEDKLCETCAEFPRFINEYGNTKEIGVAPSCKTAGELMLGFKGKLKFETVDSDESISGYNDIDPLTYIQLVNARKIAYELVQNRSFSIDERAILYITFCKEIQVILDKEEDERIANVVKKYSKEEYCRQKLDRLKAQYLGTGKDLRLVIRSYFDAFKGMEVINPDWNIYCDDVRRVIDSCSSDEAYFRLAEDFDGYYKDKQYEYEQILVYYVYRYFMDAVYDYNTLLKAKNAVVGLIVLKAMDIAVFKLEGSLDFVKQVDLAHLYSRQFEHSYYNFEIYREYFEGKRRYSYANLVRILFMGI